MFSLENDIMNDEYVLTWHGLLVPDWLGGLLCRYGFVPSEFIEQAVNR